MDSLASIVIVIFSLLVPNSLLLVLVIPVLMILSGYMEIIPPVFRIGDKPLHVHDFVILAMIFKLFAKFALTGFQVYVQSVHRYIGLFISVLFGATLIAFFRFGPVVFWSELLAFFRFSLMVSIFFLFYYSVTTGEELSLSGRYFRMIGFALSLSVYVSIVLYLAMGIHFGEVQDTAGMVRYFGPLGDQVGFIIALFCFWELLAGKALNAVVYGGAIFATGTRGAIITLIVGLLMILWMRRKENNQRPKWARFAVAALAAGLTVGFGTMMLARFTDVEILRTGLTQRTLSMGLGLEVFLGNILTGVGYSGFRFAALQYDPESLFPTFVENVITNTSNQFLQVATDAGIPGLVAFLLLMRCCYAMLKSAEGGSPPGLKNTFVSGRVWLVSLLAGNQTAVWMLQGSIITYLFWLLVAMAAVSTLLHETNANRIAAQAIE